MKSLPIGSPQTIFDWVALRDEFRGKVEVLDLDPMSVMYGLSSLVGFSDGGFIGEVESFFARAQNPIRARFDFAYQLVSGFWDTYENWYSDIRQFNANENAGHFVPEFHDKVLKWLIDGLKAYSSEMEVMDSAYFVVSRIGNYDTFLEEADIPLLEAAAGKEISINTSEGGKELIELWRKFFNNRTVEKEADQPDTSSPKTSEETQ